MGNVKKGFLNWRSTVAGAVVAIALLAQPWIETGEVPENWLAALGIAIWGVLTGDAANSNK